MKMTNAQMFESAEALSRASEEKGLLGYAIAVNLRRLSTELVEYNRIRDALLAEHGTEAGGGRYNLTPEGVRAFSEALRPYEEVETDVAVMQVPPDVFYGGGLTSGQMFTLAWMTKEVETDG